MVNYVADPENAYLQALGDGSARSPFFMQLIGNSRHECECYGGKSWPERARTGATSGPRRLARGVPLP